LDLVEIGGEIGVRCVDGNPKRDRRATDKGRFVRKWSGVINQAVVADAERVCLVDARGFLFRIDSFYVLATLRVEWVVSKFVGAFFWLSFCERPGAEYAVGIPVL